LVLSSIETKFIEFLLRGKLGAFHRPGIGYSMTLPRGAMSSCRQHGSGLLGIGFFGTGATLIGAFLAAPEGTSSLGCLGCACAVRPTDKAASMQMAITAMPILMESLMSFASVTRA
jgi:hypothetical protein